MSPIIDRRFVLETIALVTLALVCAVTANAFAARDRQVALVGEYPGALTVSSRPSGDARSSELGARSPENRLPLPPENAISTSTMPTQSVTTAEPASVPTSSQWPDIPMSGREKPDPAKTLRTDQPATKIASPTVSAQPKTFAPHPDRPWVEIAGDDAVALYARKVPFFDARRTNAYEEGHIAGARNISVWESDVADRVRQVYEENLDPDGPIVIYCSGGDCEDSHMLAEKLWGLGLNNVLVYKDGFPDWVARGGLVTRGSKP